MSFPLSPEQIARRFRFQSETGFTDEETAKLAAAAHRAKKYNERYCNGDPHPEAPDKQDKSDCSARWAADLETVTLAMEHIATPKGYTVEYNGLRPCLKKGGQYFEIPH